MGKKSKQTCTEEYSPEKLQCLAAFEQDKPVNERLNDMNNCVKDVDNKIEDCTQRKKELATSFVTIGSVLGGGVGLGILGAMLNFNDNNSAQNINNNNGYTYQANIYEFLFFVTLLLFTLLIPILAYKYLSEPWPLILSVICTIICIYLAYKAAAYLIRNYNLKKIVAKKMQGIVQRSKNIKNSGAKLAGKAAMAWKTTPKQPIQK